MSKSGMSHIHCAAVGARLRERGVRDVEELADNALVADWEEGSTDALCQSMAGEFGGCWFPDAERITWNPCGGKKALVIVHPIALQDVLEAHQVASDLGVAIDTWSLGGIAEGLLRWIGPLPPVSARHEGIERITLNPSVYHRCQPGSYPEASLWDIDHAFWQLTERLPSLLCSVRLDGRLSWGDMGDGASRWRDLKSRVRTVRQLRMRLHGRMLGVLQPYTYYTTAGVRKTPARWGNYANAAMLSKRAVYELTALQAREGGIYANTDCVALPGDREPAVWRAAGVDFKLEARGGAEFVGVGIYQIGAKKTEWFDDAKGLLFRGEFDCRESSFPDRVMFREWI